MYSVTLCLLGVDTGHQDYYGHLYDIREYLKGKMLHCAAIHVN